MIVEAAICMLHTYSSQSKRICWGKRPARSGYAYKISDVQPYGRRTPTEVGATRQCERGCKRPTTKRHEGRHQCISELIGTAERRMMGIGAQLRAKFRRELRNCKEEP
jgi:hypothetical protein